ncbi:MAG TPA: TIGR03619 family F420-dependent LLM class oxidoreductase [Actinospica sp.]|nr:TIGR03619 family F420-dependent LLM class oxidoreductase [Actinospica sp.]
MKIGIGAPVSGAWAGPAELARFGGLAEELGYDSLWTFQRLLAPADGSGDPVYRSVLDPMLALTYLAAHTSSVRLGVALVNVPFVSPAYLAKQASTLDVLSDGGLDLGLGIGWSPLEFAASNAATERRGKRAEEFVAAMRALWTRSPAEFAGEFYTIPPSRMDPKPVQPGGPPILLGGVVPAALERAGRIADGWMSRSGTILADIASDIATVRGAAERAGRDPRSVRIVSRGVVRYDPSGTGTADKEGRRLRLSGTADQIREDAAWLAEQGVTELFYDLNWDPRIGSPDADRAEAVERAEEILRALAP